MKNYRKTTLVLFTSYFPYIGGEQFLETEIIYLSNAFEKIYIIPTVRTNKFRYIPKNVEIIDIVATANKNIFTRISKALTSMFFYKNISLNIKELKYHFINHIYLGLSQNAIKDMIYSKKIIIENTIFYTYWFNYTTTAISLIKNKYPNLTFFSRVHRGDLYEERLEFKEFPTRNKVLKTINKVFSISSDGKIHLTKKFPKYSEKFLVARLGVNQPNFKSLPSDDNTLRIVSCSYLVPVKRVNLIIKALENLNSTKIEWTHIGDGILKERLLEESKIKLGKNIKYNFLGTLTNNQVFEFYQNHKVDVFINVSASEGIPVSIMEAQSCSIPIIATDVGGTREIVNNTNGVLLSANPTIKEIKKQLIDVHKNKDKWNKKRELSFSTWNEYYNADSNYKNFIETIHLL